jgi:uncharacterized paraquat-inducible protein A
MSVVGVIIRERKEKDKNMECEFCDNLATVGVTQGNISQAACNGCAEKLNNSWSVWEFDVSPWDFAG